MPGSHSKHIKVDKNGKITDFAGGALAGAEDINTTAAEPADYMDFWHDALTLLDSLKIDFNYKYEYRSGGVVYDAMELEISVPIDDYYVETYPQLWEKDARDTMYMLMFLYRAVQMWDSFLLM